MKFDQRQDREYVVDFKYYDNPPEGSAVGDSFDLRRNYYYRFFVDKRPESDEMSASVDVVPYDRYDLGPVFGI